ncbi:MAG: hypothetical protein JXQ73_26075 [Phycisphaerae bacterium]|nr:hypothetical protein [Phycisphaerae bacterium]
MTNAVGETHAAGFPSVAADHQRKRLALGFVVALIPFTLLVYRFDWLVDDAFISFRYAKHLAQGHGLRFNVSERPPVEGYSNFLWVLVLASFERFGLPAPIVSRVISIACGVVLLWRVLRLLTERLKLPPPALFVSAVFLSTLPPLAVWATSGLATVPFALLVFVVYELLLADPKAPRGLAGGIASALVILLRVDGMVWVGALIGVALLGAVVKRETGVLGRLAVCAGIAGATLIALTVFRLAYFGWPLPNTVYAKVGMSAMTLARGGKYVACFLLTFPQLMVILVWGAVVVLRTGRDWTLGPQVVLILLFGFGYPALAGGDWMAMGRLLVPAMPFLAILFGILLGKLPFGSTTILGLGAGCVVLSLLPMHDVHVIGQGVRQALHFRYNTNRFASEYEEWRVERDRGLSRALLGRTLARYTQPGESIVMGAIGAVGYYSELIIYDTAGLVHPEIAHRDVGRRRSSAGHDKGVPPSFFLKYHPTYYLAFLLDVPEERASAMEPGRWARVGGRVCQPEFYPPSAAALYDPLGLPLPAAKGCAGAKLLILFVQKDRVEDRLAQRP